MNQHNYCQTIPTSDPLASYNSAINERPSNKASSSGRKKRSVGEHTKYWRPGRTLRILVFEYNEHSFEAIKNGANKWQPYVNLNFEFIEMDEQDIFKSDELLGDIRVAFYPRLGGGGSSAIGTDSLTGDPQAPSMSFFQTDFSSPDFESMVIHEFGHALGLHHEHQHPDAKIPWDRKKAYFHFAAAANLSREQVDANVFPLERTPNRTYTPYDRYSVMHYQVHNELTVGDWHQPLNRHISEGDIAAIRAIYP
ncbi:peptidase M12 [Pseudomonas fluorescens HK44]|uniref:Peptidase M12 n=1 Tax=Pseudomonas fluorescens HK44 TaxID=1042209 RepID=A0A010TBZ3_PSEFL|nr:M12 family metallopeptidase [Pseudomonas fluorescens]EXF94777.1 peptidase M12 [Pseudomonas fluorescens HK44]